MIKIKMLKTLAGSEDGIRVKSFVAGKTYDVEESLAEVFLNIKVAEKVIEEKIIKAAPENKKMNEDVKEVKKDK